MKKYSILIGLLFISLNMYCQDKEPNAWLFKYNNNVSPQVFNYQDFQQTNILFGFQWGASKNMNDALGNLCSSLYLSNKYYDEYRKVLCSILLTNYKENL